MSTIKIQNSINQIWIDDTSDNFNQIYLSTKYNLQLGTWYYIYIKELYLHITIFNYYKFLQCVCT